jgi:hypothetical protein
MTELKYRGRVVTAEDILYIRELIAAHPRASRRRLSEKLCEAWQWKQANGALRDMVCRGLLLMLDRAGKIELPGVKFVPHNPFVERARPEPRPVDATPILAAFGGAPARGDRTGAAHGSRTSLQQPDGTAPLPGL